MFVAVTVVLPQLIIPLLSFTLFIFVLRKWLSGTLFPTQENAPPSPRKLPLIGNLHQLGTSPHRSLWALSNLHGPLMLLHLGHVPVLVASSAEAAREIMKIQDAVFANRPKLSIEDKLTYGSKDVAFAPYGEHWRLVRSITVLHLLSNKRVRSYGRVREEETSAMVERIRRLGVVNLHEVLFSLSNDIVCRVALGRKYGEDQNFMESLREVMEVLGYVSLRDYIPWLGRIIDHFNHLDARVESISKRFDAFLEDVIQEHKDRRKDGDVNGEGDMDLVDILLDFQRDNESVFPVEDDTIKALIQDMFAAGSDSSASTMVWAMAEVIKNPRTMRILGDEVRQAAGTKKEIDEGDTEKMKYLKAVIKETLRLHPPAPLLIRRESTQDTRVMGYDISAGTQVLINAWAIGRDPSSWENPEEFRPERFLDSNIDFKGQHFELVPFGAGRRGCPGIAFGLAVVELGVAKLVHSFEFALPNGERGEDLDMTESTGFGVEKKLPLLVTTTSVAC